MGQESNEGEKNTYVLSVVEEKSFGKTQCRCIMWTKDGPKRLVIVGSFKSKHVKHILAQFGYSGSKIDQPPKQVRHTLCERYSIRIFITMEARAGNDFIIYTNRHNARLMNGFDMFYEFYVFFIVVDSAQF